MSETLNLKQACLVVLSCVFGQQGHHPCNQAAWDVNVVTTEPGDAVVPVSSLVRLVTIPRVVSRSGGALVDAKDVRVLVTAVLMFVVGAVVASAPVPSSLVVERMGWTPDWSDTLELELAVVSVGSPTGVAAGLVETSLVAIAVDELAEPVVPLVMATVLVVRALVVIAVDQLAELVVPLISATGGIGTGSANSTVVVRDSLVMLVAV